MAKKGITVKHKDGGAGKPPPAVKPTKTKGGGNADKAKRSAG